MTIKFQNFLVKNLPGELVRLVEDNAAVLGVSVVTEIGALVDETPACSIDHDTERLGVFLEVIAYGKITEFGRVTVPGDGVTARPVAVRCGTYIECYADAIAGVEA